MGNKILIIVNTFLYDFVQTTIEGSALDCDIRIITYNDFNQIPEIYESNREWADGVLVNGRMAHAALENSYPEHSEPFLFFDPTLIGLYRQIIDLFVLRKDLDTHRVVFDFLLPLYENPTVDFFLHHLEIPDLSNSISDWITGASFSHFPLLQKQIIEKIIALWNAREADFIVCTYGSIVPEMQKRGIAHQYIPPEASQLLFVLTDIQERLQLKRMRDNLPAVIAVSYMDRDCSLAPMRTLQRALTELKKDFATNYIIQETPDRYYLYTSLKAVDMLTDKYRNSFFLLALQQKYNLHAAVGYGIGTDISAAKIHADIAIREALFSDGSFLVDEQQNLIGPLGSKLYLKVAQHASKNISNIAKKCKLSPLTIQKIISVIRQTESDLVTAQSLGDHLGVTSRNANRILTCLQNGGYATISCTQPTSTKGRPVKVYKLLIEA